MIVIEVFRAFDQGLSRMRWNDFRQTLAVGSKESGIAVRGVGIEF